MVWFEGVHYASIGLTEDMMKIMMAVLCDEKKRLEKKLEAAERSGSAEKTQDEKQLEIINHDINRLEMYIDRPDMQTWSELIFVDDIRQRVRQLQADTENQGAAQ